MRFLLEEIYITFNTVQAEKNLHNNPDPWLRIAHIKTDNVLA